MSFTVHIFTGCDTQHFGGPGEDKHFHILDQKKGIMDDSYDLDQN